jgi:predicted outer membrane lipoprotein
MSINAQIAANASSDAFAIVAGLALILIIGWVLVCALRIIRAMKGGAA